MAMMRRNFIEAGIGGVAALSVAQGVARAQSPGGARGLLWSAWTVPASPPRTSMII